MRRAALAAVLLLALNDDVKKTCPDATEVAKSARRLDAEGRKKVEEALGATLPDEDLREPIFEAKATVPEVGGSDKVAILWMAVTVKGPKGTVRVAVAKTESEPVVAGVAVLKNDDLPAAAEKAFLKQFESMLLSSNLHQPPAKLEEARKAGGQADALLATQARMHKVGAAWDRLEVLVEKQDAKAKDEAEAVKALFGDVEAMAPKYEFLTEGQRTRLAKNLKAAAEQVKELAELVASKKWTEATQRAHETVESCSKCHSGMRRQFRAKREDLGLGNGNFVLDLDVTPTADDARGVQQAVATGVRKALLILSEAR
jgi:Na+-translocating ferredoxin:NAD+ oxidoreductase RnfG subunit